MRRMRDSLGEIEVPEDVLWGPQTARSLKNFPIGQDTMPREIIMAIVEIKRAAALVNERAGKISSIKKDRIVGACDRLLSGEFSDQFPLKVWQTGSGTQTNMNVNEVIAALGEDLHPNDDVNASQSTNDVFPTAIAMVAVRKTEALKREIFLLIEELEELKEDFGKTVKMGRTHLQDAVPLTFDQEIGGWIYGLRRHLPFIDTALTEVRRLPIGGTAVGTGLNTPKGYSRAVVKELSRRWNTEFSTKGNRFATMSLKGDFVALHGGIAAFAGDLFKIANDLRFYSCGPRGGIGEWNLPANEPGSSIMPGKINPTQIEALTMVIARVMGNGHALEFASTQGQCQLNAYMPLFAKVLSESLDLLAQSIGAFREHCVKGMTPVPSKIREHLEESLMTVTALSPVIGYEKAAEVAKKALREGTTLRVAALDLGVVTEEKFDEIMDPERMV